MITTLDLSIETHFVVILIPERHYNAIEKNASLSHSLISLSVTENYESLGKTCHLSKVYISPNKEINDISSPLLSVS